MSKTRLRAAQDLLPRCGRIADIGAGDGALALSLARSGEQIRVVATEVSAEPFARLARACAAAPLVEVRLGDGLAPLRGEVFNAIALLGMGARTILEILRNAHEQPNALFVLGPMQHAPTLRAGVGALGLRIVDERLVLERGRLYELIAAHQGEAAPLSWLDQQIGPVLRTTRPPGFSDLCRKRIVPLSARLMGAAPDQREDLLRKIRSIEEACDGPQAV